MYKYIMYIMFLFLICITVHVLFCCSCHLISVAQGSLELAKIIRDVGYAASASYVSLNVLLEF